MVKEIDLTYEDDIVNTKHKIIGKRLLEFIHDPFVFSNSVYNRVSFIIEDKRYMLKNDIQVIDYYGADEDICIMRIAEVDSKDIVSALENVKQEHIPVNAIISDVKIIIENSSMFVDDEKEYELSYVYALVLEISDGRKIIFSRTDDFSESIEITRCTELDYDKIFSLSESIEEIDENIKFVKVRKIGL